jgi:hypothetical protein
MTEPYSGPTVPEMLKTHTLAIETINRHAGPDSQRIFDGTNLRLLYRFVSDPSAKDTILKDEDLLDEPGQPVGQRANKVHRNLVGYLIAHHGTEGQLLDAREIDMLRVWFESGAADEAMENE